MLAWSSSAPDRGWLRDRGYAVLTWQALNERYVRSARVVGPRTTLDAPATPLVERFEAHERVAVIDVELPDVHALRTLHDFALRPAWQAGCRLRVHADRRADRA